MAKSPRDDLRKLFGPVALSHKFWSRKSAALRGCAGGAAHSLMPEHAAQSALDQVLCWVSNLWVCFAERPKARCIPVRPIRAGLLGPPRLFYLDSKPIMVAEFFLREKHWISCCAGVDEPGLLLKRLRVVIGVGFIPGSSRFAPCCQTAACGRVTGRLP